MESLDGVTFACPTWFYQEEWVSKQKSQEKWGSSSKKNDELQKRSQNPYFSEPFSQLSMRHNKVTKMIELD